MDRWTDGQIEIYWLESLPPLLKEWTDGQIKIIRHESLPMSFDHGQMDRRKDRNNQERGRVSSQFILSVRLSICPFFQGDSGDF